MSDNAIVPAGNDDANRTLANIQHAFSQIWQTLDSHPDHAAGDAALATLQSVYQLIEAQAGALAARTRESASLREQLEDMRLNWRLALDRVDDAVYTGRTHERALIAREIASIYDLQPEAAALLLQLITEGPYLYDMVVTDETLSEIRHAFETTAEELTEFLEDLNQYTEATEEE